MTKLAALVATVASLRVVEAYPTDCRNQTWIINGGKLVPMSWHIHYTTETSDMKRFYEAFVAKFLQYFPSTYHQCPFGPNWGSYEYRYVCSLESALEREFVLTREKSGFPPSGGSPWGSLSQRAFFIPVERIAETWAWAMENQDDLDVFKHANTGCMHDDHGLRGNWSLVEGRTAPTITTLDFPCNVPSTGCNDSQYSGPPFCGCTAPLASDAPADSCKNCVAGKLPPSANAFVI